MFEKIRKMKNKKGFTLVELIVVLVILAILAALLIPALTGYIDKANAEKVVAETRMVVMAIQTESSSTYAKGVLSDTNKPSTDSIKALAEVKGLDSTSSYKAEVSTTGTVLAVQYNNGSFVCVYKDGAYTVKKDSAVAGTSSVEIKDTATIDAVSPSIV